MKYSISVLAWMLTTFATYLICSAAISIIAGCSYRQVLCDSGQLVGLIFVYWWLPAAFVAGEVYEWLETKYRL